MKSLLSLLLLGACASTTGTMDREATIQTGVHLDLSPAADTLRVIPAAKDPRLPRVDRMATQIRYELGDAITAELELCVNPNGDVTDVMVTRTSGLSDLDTAITNDVRAWQFDELPGSPSLRTCQRTQLSYRVR